MPAGILFSIFNISFTALFVRVKASLYYCFSLQQGLTFLFLTAYKHGTSTFYTGLQWLLFSPAAALFAWIILPSIPCVSIYFSNFFGANLSLYAWVQGLITSTNNQA